MSRRRSAVSAASRWVALPVIVTGSAMAMLDLTLVNIALPTLRQSLHGGESVLSWAIAGFSLANALVLIPAGRLGDRIGHARVYLIGLGVFAVASMWSGLAPDVVHLIAARILQGIGAGMVLPSVGALIQLMFAGPERARAFAVLGMAIGVVTAIGPSLGGLIIHAAGEDGWRWVFFVNVPVSVVVIALGLWLLPRKVERRRTRTDLVGVVLLGIATLALLIPVVEGREWGWPWWAIAVVVAGALTVIVFAAWERRVERRDGVPLVPPRLFRYRSFSGGVVLAGVFFAAFTSIWFTLSLLWQSGLGHTPLETGLSLLPTAVGAVIGASQSARLALRLGRTALLIGSGLVTIGLVATCLVVLLVDVAALSWLPLAVPLFVIGLGNGLFITPNLQFVVATVEPRDAGAANGVVSATQRLGAAVGVAVAGSVLFTVAETSARQGASAIALGAAAALGVSAVLAAIAFGLVWTLPRRRLH